MQIVRDRLEGLDHDAAVGPLNPASYKAAGNDQIGWSAWPRWFREPWELVMNHATPEQLACLGVPAPGDPFWTELTLRRTSERWPEMDLTAHHDALSS